MTDPFLADTETIIRQSHRQIVRARATHPSFEGAVELDVEDVRIDFQERRVPRVVAQVTIPVFPTQAEIDTLDPRAGVRVEIDCGYVRPGGIEDVFTIVDLGLRKVTIDRPSDKMMLECASDEMLVIDGSPAASASVTAATHSAAMQALINNTINPKPEYNVTITGGAVTVDPVTDRWDTVNDLADRLEAQVYDDGLRDWFIEPIPTAVGTASVTLKVGENGTVLSSSATLDREQWFNYVFVRYRWRDASDVDKVVSSTAYVQSGPYAITGPAGKRILMVEREVQTNQTEANKASKSILNRQMSKSRSFRVTAIAAYWLRPGMTVSLTLPGQTAQKHLVTAVSFNPLQGTMGIDTRLPDILDVGTTTPPPVIPTDPPPPKVDDPVPPPKQSYRSQWVASSSQAYQGDGDKRTDIPTEIAQGYWSSFNGNQQSIVLFTSANSTGSESGVSITTALTGAEITKVEVWLYANHWYSNAGGIARIGYYNGTTIPTTFTGAKPYATAKDWTKNSGRWVNINSAAFIADLLDGSARGITIGPGSGANQIYYGKFNGATASSNKPILRITYSK